MLNVAIWYVSIRPVVMWVKEELQFFIHLHNNRTYRDVPNRNMKYKSTLEDGLLKSETC